MPANDGRDLRCRSSLMRIDVKNVLRNDNQVGEFANFQRTFRFFTATRERSSQRVAIDGLLDGQALFRNEAVCRRALCRLPRHRGLDTFPWAESHYRPIAAECQVAASIRDALPCPCSRSAMRTGIARPNAGRVGSRMSA